ncbi:MAG: MOP flippase family protein [Anaerolineales bacterium]|jgi:PST family polysaccharide transporter
MSLAKKTISGTKWSAFSQFGRQGLGFVTTAILARLLTPDAYGILGMATVVTGFIAVFKDLGTSSALIQRKVLTDNLVSSIFWVNTLFGLLTSGFVVVIAPLVALFYREPQVIPILRVLSFSFIISGLSISQQALLTRQMAFYKLARIELVSSALAGLVGVAMAIAGMGVWSLVGQTLCQSIVITALLWIVFPWRPRLVLAWREVRLVASYSLNLSGFNIFNYFVRNADNILIGRYLGTAALGYYSIAYRLMLYPLQSFSGVLGRVLFPVFTQMQEDNIRFRKTYLRICTSISLIAFPMMLGIVFVSEPFVYAIMGSRWMQVSTILIILAPLGVIQSIATTVGHIYKAKGRTDWMFIWGLLSGITVLFFFVIGLRWGVVGVAGAYAAWSLIMVYPNFVIPFKLIELSFRDLVIALWPTLRASLIMSGCVAILRVVLMALGIDQPWLVLVITIPIGVFTYTGFLLWSRPPIIQDLIELLPHELMLKLWGGVVKSG